MAEETRDRGSHPYNRTATAGKAREGQINPSGPTTGTEGRVQGEGEGGMRGSSGAGATGPNPSSSTPGDEGGGRRSGEDRTFRCADVGNADCRWEVTGRTEEELMPQIERHGRESHGVENPDQNKIRNAIRERRAA
jgi:predicted small metal-binding protein